MAITTTISCDHCGSSEELEVWDNHTFDLPDGWIVDPEDDEQHICEWCAQEQGLVEADEVEYIEPPQVVHGHKGWTARCSCGADVWSENQPTTPVQCNVCLHLKPNALMVLTSKSESGTV